MRDLKIATSVGGLLILAVLVLRPYSHGTDAFSYWSFDPAHPYLAAMGNLDAIVAFRYGPPFAVAVAPLHVLPWPVFLWLWTALAVGALAFMTRSWALVLVLFYPVFLELDWGNVHLLMAAAIVLGFRYPSAWAFVFWTKQAPAIGLLWFAARGEWALLLRAVLWIAIAAVLAGLVAPGLWPQWIAMLLSNIGAPGSPDALAGTESLIWRLGVAVVLIVIAARRDWKGLLPVACMLALPTIWPDGLAMLVGVAPFLNRRKFADGIGQVRSLLSGGRGRTPARNQRSPFEGALAANSEVDE